MDTTEKPRPPRDWREGRRLRAWELKQQGWQQGKIAEALGVSPGAVSQWLKRAREEGGPEALRRRPAPGPRPRLSGAQQQALLAILRRGAEAYQFRGDVWTAPRIAQVIRQEFGVRYDPGHVSRLLRTWGWSVQKPRRQASQRNEQAIAT
jgi:transposase